MKLKAESEKVGLKLNIQKTKIMASGPITSWEIDGETVSDFMFLGSKITVDGDCSHEIKRRLLLGRKVMKGDQSWVFIGRTDVEAELQYFVHPMRRADSFEKTWMLEKIEGARRRG